MRGEGRSGSEEESVGEASPVTGPEDVQWKNNQPS